MWERRCCQQWKNVVVDADCVDEKSEDAGDSANDDDNKDKNKTRDYGDEGNNGDDVDDEEDDGGCSDDEDGHRKRGAHVTSVTVTQEKKSGNSPRVHEANDNDDVVVDGPNVAGEDGDEGEDRNDGDDGDDGKGVRNAALQENEAAVNVADGNRANYRSSDHSHHESVTYICNGHV